MSDEMIVLCYGDSNTWGYDPVTKERYAREVRWTGVLQQELGERYIVVAEGLNGRTTVLDDPLEDYRCGKEYLLPCLRSHKPLDLVVLMLGTNDLKARFSLPACDIAAGAGLLVQMIRQSQTGPSGRAPRLLLVAPPPLGKLSDFAEMFAGGLEKSLALARHFRLVAEEHGCALLDAAEVVTSSDVDGVHFDPGEHRKLGTAIADRIREMIEPSG